MKIFKFSELTDEQLNKIIDKHYSHWSQYSPLMNLEDTTYKIKNIYTSNELPYGIALIDNDDIIGIITQYNCNNTVAYLHTDGVIEKYSIFDNGDRYYLFGNRMLRSIYKASKHDKRACEFWENKIDDYNHDYIEDTYILRYGKNDLLK